MLCGAPLRIVLDLGRQPLANALLRTAAEPSPTYPLRLGHCGCGHLQLADRVPPRALFTDYVYRTGANRPMVEHFELLAQVLPVWMPQPRTWVCEVGSNDGTFLRALRGSETKHSPGGLKAVGVDPSSVAREVEGTVPKFFSAETAGELLAEHGPAGAVVMSNVLAHCPDPRVLLAGARDLLPYGGVLVIEVPWARHLTWDAIYHEHYSFWTATALERLLRTHGFHVERVQQLPIHGGSLRVFARRAIVEREAAPPADWLRGEVAGGGCHAWSRLLLMERYLGDLWSGLQERCEAHRRSLWELCDDA
ncbi:MAG TPA: class I SAM-dependent methyltransferase, partial [Armatimonadota bacterium]|nr:class I SAM-dependent methyltransferase [Armatimonadota bacterium]